jgi:small-conductance mechanosensitive channel
MDYISKIASPKGIGLVITFIVLFIAVGFIIKARISNNKPVVAARIMRYLVLPTLLIYTLCRFIFELPRTSVSIKLTETILIIFGISFLLQMMSHLFFSKDNILSGKETIPKLGRDIIQFLLVLISSVFVFSVIWGFDLGYLLTALGVGSFVLGLALQEPLGNLFNGIALLIAKPFAKGDWIEIGDDIGKIVDINWRSAKIVNRFNELIIIPNNALGKERIKNLSRPTKIHAEMIEIGFSYNDHPSKVKEALVEIANLSRNVLTTPAPIAIVISYDDFYINYGLKFFVNDYAGSILIKDEILTQIYEITKDKGLTIPFPIQEIHLKNNL